MEKSLKKLIDSEIGAQDNICVYNKYGDFLCEGKVAELRSNYLWALLDEENARISKVGRGVAESGENAIVIHLSNVPSHERKIEEKRTLKERLEEKKELAKIENTVRNKGREKSPKRRNDIEH